MATSSSSTESSSSTPSSSSSSSRAATPTPASGPVTFADLTTESLAQPDAATASFPLAGGRYSVMATSTPPGSLGLELQLPDGSWTAFIQNSINAVGQNMSFAQAASAWMLVPGTYRVVASGPFTGGNLTITPF